MRWLLLIMLCTPLCAQSFDESQSRFLSSPHGRTGTWAPYRAVLSGLEGLDTVTVRSLGEGVALEKQVAVSGLESAEVVLPVYVHESARLEVGEVVIIPRLPMRRVEPDYARAYTAVFSTDPVYARGVLPSTPTGAICDYYALEEFFTDWRLLDGYDAVVIFNPTDVRLPPGSQRAIADFCSLGGAVLIAGSFRLGEKVVDLPPFAEPTLPAFRGVRARRFGYGAGAIYRFEFNDLRDSPSAHLVMADALHDHMWFGAAHAPAGTPESRVPPARPPSPPPLPPDEVTPSPLFWALCGALLLICVLTPVVGARVTKHGAGVQGVLVAACVAVGAGALLQESPLPVLEVAAMARAGEGVPASARLYMQVEDAWGDTLRVSLDDEASRDLPRYAGGPPGWRAWTVDRPLVALPDTATRAVRLHNGRVGELTFRDFATLAHKGGTEFSGGEAFVLDWWLEENAYRGRGASVTPQAALDHAFALGGARTAWRGAIRVTAVRQ